VVTEQSVGRLATAQRYHSPHLAVAATLPTNMSELSEEELDEIYAFAVRLGKDAGEMLQGAARVRMGNFGGQEQKEHVQKESAVDLVTETDESKLPLLHRSFVCS
jgi:hypothetical protein